MGVPQPGLSGDRKRLALTLLGSLLIHIYFLWAYDNFPRGFSERIGPTDQSSLEIQIARASLERIAKPASEPKLNSRPASTDNSAASTTSSRPTDASKLKQPSAGEADTDIPARQGILGQPTEQAKIPGLSTLITSLEHVLPNDQPGIACDKRERASKIRRCDEEKPYEQMRQRSKKFEGSLGDAFARLNPSNAFHRDMLKVESLLGQQKQLATMLALHGNNDADLKAQHRAVTDEIHRIDQKYASVDLFKVLGTGVKFTTALINQQRQKKQ